MYASIGTIISRDRYYNGSWASSCGTNSQLHFGIAYYSTSSAYDNFLIIPFSFSSYVSGNTPVTVTFTGSARFAADTQTEARTVIAHFTNSADITPSNLSRERSTGSGYNMCVYDIPYANSTWTANEHRSFTFSFGQHYNFSANTTYYLVLGGNEGDSKVSGQKGAWYNTNFYYGSISISTGTAYVSTHPTAYSLTFNGSYQSLCSAGSCVGGTMYYKVGSGSYSTSIPSGYSAGTYTLQYYVLGSGGYESSEVYTIYPTISQLSVSAPYLIGGSSHVYTSNEITQEEWHSQNYCTKSGTSSATNVGTYTMSFALNDTTNMIWADTGGNATRKFTWYITRLPITKPSLSDSGHHNWTGSAITQSISYSQVYCTLSGTQTATNYSASGFTIWVSLNSTSQTMWADGTDAAIGLTWYIDKVSPAFATQPSGTTFTFDNVSHPMCSTGSVKNGYGTIYYKVSGGSYSTTIPTRTSHGSTTVYYYIKGDSNHLDTAEYNTTGVVNVRQVTSPTVSGTSYTYDGNVKTPTISGVLSAYVKTSGTTSATNASTSAYYITFTLRYAGDCTWTDGTTADINVAWHINKATPTLTLSKTLDEVSYPSTTTTEITYTTNSPGTISISPTSTTICSRVEHYSSATKFKFTLSGTKGNQTFTITLAETTNYYGATIQYLLKVVHAYYTITYTHRSGNNVLGTTTETVDQGTSLTLADKKQTYSGYNYSQATLDDGTTVVTTYTISGATTFILWYTKLYYTYTVSYDKNSDEASGTMSNSVVSSQDDSVTITLKSCEFTRSGYGFSAWCRTQTHGTEYTQITFTRDPSAGNQSATVYAYWVRASTKDTYIMTSSGWVKATPYIMQDGDWTKSTPKIYKNTWV